MFPLSTLIIIAVAALIVGALIGMGLTKGLSPQEKQNRNLEHRLQKAEEQLRDYQHEVSTHFAETSQLVNSLTQSYRDVHEHLASSALKLTNPDISRQLIDAADGKLLTKPKQSKEDTEYLKEAPRDWAPKNPGDKGQLSEDFGLDNKNEESPETTVVR